MPQVQTPEQTIAGLRRRLNRWELDHLRKLAAELHERLERAEDEAARAWESAEFWQRNAMDLQDELMQDGYTIGLTRAGQIVAKQPDAERSSATSDAEVGNDRIEQVDGTADEHDSVILGRGGQDHLNAGADGIERGNVNLVNGSGQSGAGHELRQPADARVTELSYGPRTEIAHQDGDGESLSSHDGLHDGQFDSVEGRQEGAGDNQGGVTPREVMVQWPAFGITLPKPIDWSVFVGREVILHLDPSHSKEQ